MSAKFAQCETHTGMIWSKEGKKFRDLDATCHDVNRSKGGALSAIGRAGAVTLTRTCFMSFVAPMPVDVNSGMSQEKWKRTTDLY